MTPSLLNKIPQTVSGSPCPPAMPSEPVIIARTPVPICKQSQPICAHPQGLPCLVLHKIFSYLPFSAQTACTQVCRHWYNNLPDNYLSLTRWLRQHPPPANISASQITAGYESRSRPWLARQGSELLTCLDRQQQELELLKQRAESEPGPDLQQQMHRACRCLAGLVRYSLHHQITQAPELQLRPVAIDCAATTARGGILFSPCSRWLLVGTRGTENPMQLHDCTGHHQQPGVMALFRRRQFTRVKFAVTPPNTLLTAHDSQVLVWQKHPDTRIWHQIQLWGLYRSHKIVNLVSMGNGDIITLSLTSASGTISTQILFSCYLGARHGWAEPIVHQTPQAILTCAEDPLSCRLALASSTPIPDSTAHRNEVRIWYKTPNSARFLPWNCAISVLEEQDISLQNAEIRLQGRLLLTLPTNGQLSLWTLDARHQLHKTALRKLELGLLRPSLYQLACFRSDSKQLALAPSRCYILFWDKNQDDQWQVGARLNTPPEPAVTPDSLNYILLSTSGRTLVRCTRFQITVWHRSGACWQTVVQRTSVQPCRVVPHAGLLPDGDTVVTMVQDPTPSLWIHGPDSQGRFIQKARLTTRASLAGRNASSPDGLSLLLVTDDGQLSLQQLTCTSPASAPSRS
ncbi:MAG: F-box-like domain-containing protein [Kistimonas sp.]|nr:F-box-like domain-containing protein [Kistimonas sp.]